VNPVDYRILNSDFSGVPRFHEKNGNRSRPLAKTVESGRMIENLGKTRAFSGFAGLSENPRVVSATLTLST
jgi:hypothetical protein